MHAHLLLPHTWFYAPINGLHQDVVGGGGGGRCGGAANYGKFDFFRFLNVNFPTLGSPLLVKFLPLGQTYDRHL